MDGPRDEHLSPAHVLGWVEGCLRLIRQGDFDLATLRLVQLAREISREAGLRCDECGHWPATPDMPDMGPRPAEGSAKEPS